jgi:hypothetical protein
MYIFKLIKYGAQLAFYKKLWEEALKMKNEAKSKSDEWKKAMERATFYATKVNDIQKDRNKLLDNLKTQY